MTIILTISVVLLAVVLLSVRVIFVKNGTFRSEHIAANRKMKENGIGCATSQDRKAQHTAEHKINVKEL